MAVKLKWLEHSDLAIKRRPTMRREEFLDWMTFKGGDRIPFTELFGPIIGLKEEWEEQGASEAELDFSAFEYRCESRGFIPVNTGLLGGMPVVQLEEDDEYKVWRDALGRTMKLPKGKATLALPMDYPVKNMDDWLRIRPWFEFSEARFSGGWEDAGRKLLQDGKVVCAGIPGGFDAPRQLMGEENLCLAYYEQPELVHDMLRTIGD
ncbi:MAG: hypothetical protein JW808_01300, partial [Victivallales bacterium]|nr:hypothetical protein [Victivallales bacterium]